MRTLTAPTISQKNRRTGATITRVLEVLWDGPDGEPTYYSDASFDLPDETPVLGRVRNWGTLTLQAEPGRVGGHQQLQIDLHDASHDILAHIDSDVTAKRMVRVYLWMGGTSWETDKVCLFAGTISGSVTYSDAQAVWQITAKGAETLYDKTLGIEINRKAFPQINCNECSGDIVPIVFGSNVRRIPTCPLGQPPATMLTQPLNILDDHIYLSRSVLDMGLLFETPYAITVGNPGAFETLTVVFHEVDQPSSAGSAGDLDGDSVAEILSRSSTYAAGVSLGPYGEDGLSFFTVAEVDLPEPDRNLMGFMIVINLGDDGWHSFVIDQWIDSGNGRAVVIEPDDLDFTTNQLWKILSTPGTIPMWPGGTPVNVGQGWTFCVSHLPLASVDLVEVRGKPASGADQLRYYELATEDYEVVLDDRSFNASLGRGEDDPGVTTIAINFAPSQWGGDENRLYVTASAEQTAPIEILQQLIQNEWLGDVDPSVYPVDITGAESDVAPAFAITQPVKFHETVSDLAQQFGLLLFWDAGKVCLRSMRPWGSLGAPAHSIDEDNFVLGTFSYRVKDGPAETNRLVAKWKPSCSTSREFRFTREAAAAIDIFGEKSKDLSLWAFQDRISVGDQATFWLRYWLGLQREVVVTCFLDALHLQPGDTVSVSRTRADNGDPVVVAPGVVLGINHVPGDAQAGQCEAIELTVGLRKQEWSVSAVPDDAECSIEVGEEESIPAEEGDKDPDSGDIGVPLWPPGPDPSIPYPHHPGWPQPPGSPDSGGGTGGGGGGGGGGGNYTNPRACHCPGGNDSSGGSSVESSGSDGSSGGGGGDDPECAGLICKTYFWNGSSWSLFSDQSANCMVYTCSGCGSAPATPGGGGISVADVYCDGHIVYH